MHASEPHGSQSLKEEPVADADEGDGGPGPVMSAWSDMDGRGDAAAAEEYWEDYLRGKMDLVCSILQVCRPCMMCRAGQPSSVLRRVIGGAYAS